MTKMITIVHNCSHSWNSTNIIAMQSNVKLSNKWEEFKVMAIDKLNIKMCVNNKINIKNVIVYRIRRECSNWMNNNWQIYKCLKLCMLNI